MPHRSICEISPLLVTFFFYGKPPDLDILRSRLSKMTNALHRLLTSLLGYYVPEISSREPKRLAADE